MSNPASDFPQMRRSGSNEASLEAERRRVAKMTVKERMLEALRLHAALTALRAEAPSVEE